MEGNVEGRKPGRGKEEEAAAAAGTQGQ